MQKVMVRITGERACFTRPEHKVERLTYPVITPSAARGVLESIYWKPEFRYIITRIKLLAPVRYFSIMTNELQDKQNYNSGPLSISASRTQRRQTGLSHVAYVIEALVVGTPVAKHVAIFNDRVAAGSCFRRPCLGLREYAAEFYPLTGAELPINDSFEIGTMFHDYDYTPHAQKSGEYTVVPRFFRAKVVNGVMAVPAKGVLSC